MPTQFESLEAGLASRYRLGPEIGRGGMATVYHAADLTDQRKVAIKVLREDLASVLGPQRFLREIAIARRLEHPSIVPLLDSGEVNGVLYFVMPFIEGETLRGLIRRETQLTVKEAVRIAGEIADGLGYAHREGVIHRDIKPENILLSDGRAMITDFGIARVVGALDQETLSTTGLALGTPTYMSPEQASAMQPVDARTDLYSLGCVLYEMIAGEPPFTGPTPQAVAARHMVERPRSLRVIRPAIGEHLEAAIEKALAKVPADRCQDAAEFKLLIESEETSSPRVRARMVRWLAVAVVLAAVVFAMTLVFRPSAALSTARYYIGPFTAAGSDSVTEVGPLLAEAFAQWSGVEPANLPGQATFTRGPAALDRLTSLARRAGAGRLLMGQVARRGDSSVVTARLFAIGRESRLLRQTVVQLSALTQASTAQLLDSLLVPPEARAPPPGPPGSRVVPALDAFARGRSATNRWALVEADSEFTSAIRADPDYARAYLWLALVRDWQGQPPAAWRNVVARAVGDSTRLGRGDLLKVGALEAQAGDNVALACSRWRLARDQDPTAFAGWYSLAQCLSDDHAVVRDRRSPSGWRFRSSYHEAIQSNLTAFRLLPAIYSSLSSSAFRPLRELLLTAQTDSRSGEAVLPDSGRFLGFPVLVADTIAVVPYPSFAWGSGTTVLGPSHGAAIRHQRLLFKDIALAWSSADPASVEAKLAVAIALEMNQDPRALEAIDRARRAARTDADSLRTGAAAVWMRIRAGIPNDPSAVLAGRLLADSLVARYAADSSADATTTISLLLLTGHVFQAAGVARRGQANEMMRVPGPLAKEALPLLIYAAAGGPPDSVRVLSDQVERSIAAMSSFRSPAELAGLRMELLGRPATLAFPGVVLPAIRGLARQGDYVLDAQAALVAGDTAAALKRLQSVLALNAVHPSERPLDAALPESRIMAIAGARAEARSWLYAVLDALPIAPAHIFADPARAASLVPALRYAARLIGSDPNGQRDRLNEIARILWQNADANLRADPPSDQH